MKKPKSIFFLIYLLFHVCLLIVSIYVNFRSEDFEFLLWLRSKMALMVYVSVVGLILYFINVILSGMESRNNAKEKEALQQEVNGLKAKMFDLQEASSAARHQTPKTESPKEEEQSDRDEN